MNTVEVKICVVGLGYVGLPLAVEFAKTKVAPVIGFDINQEKIALLRSGIDPTHEVGDEAVKQAKIEYTDDPTAIKKANFIIVAVPTPITDDNQPDLSLVESASQLVGENILAGTTIVFESTVYPGVTEEICVPIIQRASGLVTGRDFKVGYSPERVNPGDREHTINRIIKVVSGQDAETLDLVAATYQLVCQAGVHRAPSIKTAEAAKVIENIQRDLNIALMNELSQIFSRLGIDTKAVLDAASTKWNFHRYHPGLVGGHCIGVDPYYLTFKAQQLGYEPKVILAGRGINDSMARTVAKQVISALSEPKQSRVLVLGLTFKENVNDYRNSKAKDVIDELRSAGVEVIASDPLADDGQVEALFGVANTAVDVATDLDGIIYLVPHQQFATLTLAELKKKCRNSKPVLFDLRWQFAPKDAHHHGFVYLTL
ncbi:MAG: UDP-N-acetyl-D-galactosamine dehydrogenase [Candidatus Buchananbacteria bacterium RIFCSPHIGHO2_01_FULL_47_11b]|uniref:UDP-N-acetyl-D-galactosamine dehydrogenase n=1 Tax=Candidatus Buchananbacteria bacterium RIFCSPHIGHO2_01_FULL_47_11b TaxID=1797537 RepID=A0A1G1Y3S3_9BACT|nr:MAG: UDP-N-acetyl-D-galactosamine dehydrogenase [Candidatus Buchananbacteria bacterium RIFCSPHIGHO2_01_FULL_47_11b]